MIKWLIDHGSNPWLQNCDGNLPHHLLFTSTALAHCDTEDRMLFTFGYASYMNLEFQKVIIELIKILGTSGLGQIQNTSGDTIIHLACRNDFDFVLQDLISSIKHDASTSLTIQNSDGDTPLHIAASKMEHYLSCLKDCNPNIKNKHGNTPLHIVCEHHNLKFATALVEKLHSSPDIFNNKKELPIHIAASHSLSMVKIVACSLKYINGQNLVGDTPLHIACRAAKMDIVCHLIIEFNCRVDILNNDGDTPLHLLYDKPNRADLKRLEKFVPMSLASIHNNDGNTPLHVACRSKNITAVSFLLKKIKSCVNVPNNVGATPLHYTCIKGPLEIVKLVCDSSPNQQVNNTVESTHKHLHPGDTPLHVACRAGKSDVVQYLLTTAHKEALIIRNGQNDTPLHVACSNNVGVVKAILTTKSQEIDVNAVNSSQNTPLHIACKKMKGSDIVSFLVNELHCRCDIPNNDGNLPLHIACQMSSTSNIKTLIEAIDEHHLGWQNEKGNTAFHELFRIRCNRVGVGFTKLVVAKMGERKHTHNSYGELPIHLACRNLQSRVIKCLTSQINTTSTTNKGNTVLHESCINPDEGVLQYVVKYYEHDANITNHDGDLPLHIACRLKSIKKISSLIDKTPNINILNNHGNTPIHEIYASDLDSENHSSRYRRHSDRQQILSLFLKKNIDFTLKGACGQTLLHCICKNGSEGELKMVLTSVSTKLSSSIPDDCGNTALHLACQADAFELVNLLLSSAKVDLVLKNNEGQTPIMLATNHEIIKYLIEHGADPQPLYEMHQTFFQRFSLEKPPPTPVKLLVVGHPSVGKTSLTIVLQNEGGSIIPIVTSGPTAGVVPTDFNSKIYGAVTMYDFAGQPEYYANHDAVIHSTIKNIPPVVLLLVDLTHHKESIRDQIHFWSNFISYRCASLPDKAHMILIGSHADVLESAGKNPSDIINQLFSSHEHEYLNSKVVLKGYLHMNCTLSYSKELHKVQMLLKQSTNEIRQKGVMHFKSHCFYVLLLQLFRDKNIVTLGHVIATIKHMSIKSEKSYLPSHSEFDRSIISERRSDLEMEMVLSAMTPKNHIPSESNVVVNEKPQEVQEVGPKNSNENLINLLPSDYNNVIQMCEELDEMGHIIFIKHSSIVNLSWLILRKEFLLHDILGPLLAPLGFAQSFSDYSTGVVPMSRLRQHFGTRGDSTMLLTLLTKMEYCRELSDKAVLRLIAEKEVLSDLEKYLFFPSLVNCKRPSNRWLQCANFSYKYSWLLQCSREGELFSARFIQVLLLRVVFAFALKQYQYDSRAIETYADIEKEEDQMLKFVLKRNCTLWENGVHWLEQSGIDAVIDIVGQRTLLLLMQCPQGSEVQLIERRSQIISMVFEAKEEFCSKAKLLECFLDPLSIKHPLERFNDCIMFSLPGINDSIAKRQPYIIEHHKRIKLDELLYFEPYVEISDDVIEQLFDDANSHQQVTDEVFFSLARQLCHRYEFFHYLCHPSDTHRTKMAGLTGPERDNKHKLARLLMQIKKSPSGGTFHDLHELLNRLSIYCGRQPPQGMKYCIKHVCFHDTVIIMTLFLYS